MNPGKLVRAMIDTLPENIKLYENTELLKWKKNGNKINCEFKKYSIKTDKIIFCANGFLSNLSIKKRYNFPITLTASMTRKLTNEEFRSIGEPKEWGVLSIRPMGATVRLTKDRRILIRNTAELKNPKFMSNIDLSERIKSHKLGLEKRFPTLSKNLIEHSWSGIVLSLIHI